MTVRAPATGPGGETAERHHPAEPADTTGPTAEAAEGPEGQADGPGDRASRKRHGRQRRRRLFEDAGIVALAVIVAVLVRTFVAQAYWIPSGSMIPQLEINDRVVVSRLAYDVHPPHRGDIVVFDAPPGVEPSPSPPSNIASQVWHDAGVALGFAQDQSVLIKRVIGLPGDRIWASGGHVYVDGDLLVEPYLPAGTVTSSFGPLTVPAGHLWVMGDNRGDSLDSRVFGPIPEGHVVGRAVWKVWPFWDASFL